MALKRYVGPLDEVKLSVAGHEIGTVKQDESIVVPDELAESVAWSEHWEDGAVSAPKDEESQAEVINENQPVVEDPNAGIAGEL